MKVLIFLISYALLQLHEVHMAAIETEDGETSLHFDFKTENGQQRVEDVKYDNKKLSSKSSDVADDAKLRPDEVTMKPVEFRGGYSFISADGYEYTVKYKANKNGFQPYVTAHKLKNPPAAATL
ncbi:larval cuticle protein 65Ag1 [Lucilia cuprina]|uniref:larval cuticle protein 65Ag1 n=1 Tax=Lucilia cuprina TaxID=7375 RepID=UPI001F0540E3|nr:larval cuticle protein 65Ag1 [Lucilia cuprina]